MTPHPLLAVLLAAAAGSFPPADGRVVRHPPLARGHQAVVSFTGRVHLAIADPLDDLELDGFGAALHPTVLHRLAGPGGTIGTLDVLLVAAGLGGGSLPLRTDLDRHPRVRHARALRTRVRVHGDHRGLITLADGLAGRTELSVEAKTPGTGRELIGAGLRLVPAGEPVFAAVAPGNARSLRAFLALGFEPIGSEVIIGK